MSLQYFHRKPANGIMDFIINETPELPQSQNWYTTKRLCCDKENTENSDSDIEFDASLFAVNLIPTDESIEVKLNENEVNFPQGMQCVTSETIVNVKLIGWGQNNDGTGELTLTGRHSCGNASITLNVNVRGKNPSRAAISAALQTDILRAICWQESNWRQFTSNGLPIQNNNVDWGIMQINGAPPELRWHWRNNIERGRALLNEKKTHATAYLKKHLPYTDEMLENETLQRYNGGAYYKWNSENASWEASPPNDYVIRIRRHIQNKPWASARLKSKIKKLRKV